MRQIRIATFFLTLLAFLVYYSVCYLSNNSCAASFEIETAYVLD